MGNNTKARPICSADISRLRELSVSPFNPLKRTDNICAEEGALYMALAYLPWYATARLDTITQCSYTSQRGELTTVNCYYGAVSTSAEYIEA
jgi:hypothetical protein